MIAGKKTILIVEDSQVQVLAVLKLLENQPLNVLCAADGKAGLELARHDHPDVVILDIQMPEMNGLEVCRRLQSDPATAKIPVILLTTQDNPETLRQGFDDGAVDFIPKDAFYETILVETLKQLAII